MPLLVDDPDPAYVALISALVQEASKLQDQLGTAQARRIASSVGELFG